VIVSSALVSRPAQPSRVCRRCRLGITRSPLSLSPCRSLCASRLLYGASVLGPHAFRRVRTSPSLAVPLPLCVRPTPSTSRGSCGLLAAVVSPTALSAPLCLRRLPLLPCPHSIFLHAFQVRLLPLTSPPTRYAHAAWEWHRHVHLTTGRSPGFPRFSVPALLCPSRAAHLRPRRPCHPPARSVRLCASLLSPP